MRLHEVSFGGPSRCTSLGTTIAARLERYFSNMVLKTETR